MQTRMIRWVSPGGTAKPRVPGSGPKEENASSSDQDPRTGLRGTVPPSQNFRSRARRGGRVVQRQVHRTARIGNRQHRPPRKNALGISPIIPVDAARAPQVSPEIYKRKQRVSVTRVVNGPKLPNVDQEANLRPEGDDSSRPGKRCVLQGYHARRTNGRTREHAPSPGRIHGC